MADWSSPSTDKKRDRVENGYAAKETKESKDDLSNS